MTLSEKIKYCRRQLHYTQQDLATAVGVTKRCIAYYESGERCPSLVIIAEMAKLFCVPVAYLVSDVITDPGDRFLIEIDRRELGYDAYKKLYKVGA